MRLPSRVGPGKTLKELGPPFWRLSPSTSWKMSTTTSYGGEKGPPPDKSETVPMEVCGKGEIAASQGGGGAPFGHKQVS